MTGLTGRLALRGGTPLAQGASRLVYAHPADPSLLVKVMRAEFLDERKRARNWLDRRKPTRMVSIFAKEMREQLVLLSRGEEIERFMARVYGFCDTDMGLGMVVKAATGAGGELAPSLMRIIRQRRYNAAIESDFERFVQLVLDSAVTLADANLENIVHEAADGGRFVLIDGYGEGALFPVKGFFPGYNRRHKERLLRELRHSVARALKSPR